MQLEDYHRFKVVNFEQYEPGKGRFNLNDAQSIRNYQQSLLYNMNEYAYYRGRSMGLSSYLSQGSSFVWPFMIKKSTGYVSTAEQTADVCSSLYFDLESFPDYCLQATKQ